MRKVPSSNFGPLNDSLTEVCRIPQPLQANAEKLPWNLAEQSPNFRLLIIYKGVSKSFHTESITK
jgi:hypothetical protein